MAPKIPRADDLLGSVLGVLLLLDAQAAQRLAAILAPRIRCPYFGTPFRAPTGTNRHPLAPRNP
jgi:uncharacterized protein (DUF2267 family)